MASKDVLVCGTLNLETTLPVSSFPLAYGPVRYRCFELRSHPSGVGFNVARALLCLRGQPSRQLPAVEMRPVVNTAGAGDALFACFLHFYWDGQTPLSASRKALVFASYKVGENGAAAQIDPHMGTPGVRLIVQQHQIEWLRPLGNDGVRGICPEIARAEIRHRVAEFPQEFVGVLLAVCPSRKASHAGSPGIPLVIVANRVKTLGDFDRGSSKIESSIQHRGHLVVRF